MPDVTEVEVLAEVLRAVASEELPEYPLVYRRVCEMVWQDRARNILRLIDKLRR